MTREEHSLTAALTAAGYTVKCHAIRAAEPGDGYRAEASRTEAGVTYLTMAKGATRKAALVALCARLGVAP